MEVLSVATLLGKQFLYDLQCHGQLLSSLEVLVQVLDVSMLLAGVVIGGAVYPPDVICQIVHTTGCLQW